MIIKFSKLILPSATPISLHFQPITVPISFLPLSSFNLSCYPFLSFLFSIPSFQRIQGGYSQQLSFLPRSKFHFFIARVFYLWQQLVLLLVGQDLFSLFLAFFIIFIMQMVFLKSLSFSLLFL